MIYGYELVLDLKGCSNIDRCSLKKYIRSLCLILGMKRYGKCRVVYFGKDRFKGYSVMQFITTSSIVGHFTDSEAFLNIFSCRKFNRNEVIKFSQTWFTANKNKSKFLRR